MSHEKNPIGIGAVFPGLEGVSLQMQPVVVPSEPAAELTLIMLGFTQPADRQMEAWVRRCKKIFEGHRFDYYKIAMVGDLPDPELETVMRVMAVSTPPDEQPHVLIVRGGAATWRQRFGVKNEKRAHLFLVDRSGVVKWKGRGWFQRQSFNALVQAGRAALGLEPPPKSRKR